MEELTKIKLELSEGGNPERVRILLAGEKGSGRTGFAMSAPSPLFLSAYAGATTLNQVPGTPYVTVQHEDTLREVLHAIKIGLLNPETIVIDTLNEVQRRMFLRRLREVGRTEPNFDDWNWMSSTLNAILKQFADLDVHLIIVTDVKYTDDHQVRTAIQGSFATDVMNYVDYAGYVYRTPPVLEGELEVTEGDGSTTLMRVEEEHSPPKSLVQFSTSDNLRWVFNSVNNIVRLDDEMDEFRTKWDLLWDAHKKRIFEKKNKPLEIVFADYEDGPLKEILPGMPLDEQINKIIKHAIQQEEKVEE